jgi:hypothetical protein
MDFNFIFLYYKFIGTVGSSVCQFNNNGSIFKLYIIQVQKYPSLFPLIKHDCE